MKTPFTPEPIDTPPVDSDTYCHICDEPFIYGFAILNGGGAIAEFKPNLDPVERDPSSDRHVHSRCLKESS
jgi:hypothetical protein